MAEPSFEEIVETFELLDDWEERYRYVIDLGKAMPPLDEAKKTPETKVDGCASQVWLWPTLQTDDQGGRRLSFDGDSDALIVRGLIAVLRALLSGARVESIAASDPVADLARLGLDQQLSSQRSNGLRAMIARVKAVASAAA